MVMESAMVAFGVALRCEVRVKWDVEQVTG